MKNLEMEFLFEERKKVGNNLYELMKERGYTKISFSQAANISRPTLNHLFEGEINSITTFGKHIEKMISVLEISVEEIRNYRKKDNMNCQVAYSNNAPQDYIPGEVEKEMFEVLRSLMDLCEIYY